MRRILSNALEMKKADIRVIKPRIGGGFGAKQSSVSEVFPAFVTRMTGRPAYLEYTRQESLTNGSPRHEMQLTVRIGADRDARSGPLISMCCPMRALTATMALPPSAWRDTSPFRSMADCGRPGSAAM